MKTPWWNGAVIHQIYPRSFYDSSGEGVGDLPGIEAEHNYIQSIGVDAVWLSPIFRSPMKVFGYDVSDYRAIDSTRKTLEDFDRFLESAHQRGLRIILDMVLSHTSDRHRWFEESRRDRHNPRSDWYVWQDARRDGTPPTHWLSVFGGSAWNWDASRAQYYLHNFLPSQPNLDLSRPEVVEALRKVLEEVSDRFGEIWPTVTFSNHDVVRTVSRFSRHGEDDERVAPMLIQLLGSVRGLPCFYQGEELGLGQVEVDRNRIVDPAG